ncbi:uncharacterized protein LOC113769357 [Coffea eugenioides]|uniref:CCHC-type domain-containing protein n=1 Tax=Coffea arabica TaxID=13443 RepID=A0A6P6XEA8_COFAR|nr:uncharacterized protein LOC113741077 [Coffea arabica]XP_027169612.1 uncharacterized protein LOC113769355 [Coffea eugenioides]XP_027169614.1 uncharacterized protein LOC113769357 [Coffea eugenioides]
MGDKIANFTGVKNFTNHVWGYPKNLRVTEIGPNVFQFQFEREEDREKVLAGDPWILDNQVLVVREWCASFEKKVESFRYTNFWVQIWNLPVHWMSNAAGKKIGGVFRKVKEIMLPPGGGKEGRHMKIFAEIDLLQPLVRGTAVKLNGEMVWIEFKYERCPDFCYKCGIIGHGDKNCRMEMRSISSHKEAQFGPWIRAGNIMVSPLRGEYGRELNLKGQANIQEGVGVGGKKGNGLRERMLQKETMGPREEGGGKEGK